MQGWTERLRNRFAAAPLTAVLGFAGFVYGLALIVYFVAFGGDGCCDQQAWGQFGDFLGGTVNPLLGVLSVYMLAATLHEQRNFVAQERQRGVLEELQRLIATTSGQVEGALNQVLVDDDAVTFVKKHAAGAGRSLPSERVLLGDFTHVAVRALERGELTGYEVAITFHTTGLAELRWALLRLDAVLRRFLSEGGDQAVADVYGFQYDSAALFLRGLDLMGLYPDGTPPYGENAVELLGLAERFQKLTPRLEKIDGDIERNLSAAAEHHFGPPG